MLAIIVTGSHTGAGFHVSRSVYNFDSRTGAPADLNSLFGNAGQTKLRKALYKLWKSKIRSSLGGNSDDVYKECLTEAEKITEIDIDRMLIVNHGVRFWAGSCLDGSAYEYDRTKGPYDFSFGQLLPMLTPYGFSLFVNKSAGPLQTLLRGAVDNKYAISLTLLPPKEGSEPNAINGVIVYDRIGQPIGLVGTMNGNQLTLHELEGMTIISDIEVTWDGKSLNGTFTNLKSKKQLPFAAAVVK